MGVGETAHDLHHVSRPGIAQQAAAGLGIGGLHGNVDGADAQGHDPLQLPGREIRQGDIIPLEEAETGVVILEIQGLPHPPGQLIDEAEHAFVHAGPGPVHQVGLKVQTQGLALLLAEANGFPLPLPLHLQAETGFFAVVPVIQHVQDGVAVDGEERILGPDSGPVPGASRVDAEYALGHGTPP